MSSKITVIGSISSSPFIRHDIEILKRKYDVETVDIIGKLNENKYEQYIKLGLLTLTSVVPKVFKSDIVYIWFADLHALVPIVLCKLLKKKSIIAIGGYEVSNMPEINYGMMRQPLSIRAKLCKWIIRNTDVCITPSQSYYFKTKPYTSSYVANIPNCTILPQLNLSNVKNNIVLMVGQADKNNYLLKGIPEFNEAAKQIPYASFYVIGRYDQEIADKYNNVYYLGEMGHEMVIRWMKSSIVYCQLSHTESFGMSVMESMLCGCTPVVTNVDNLPDIIYPLPFVTDHNVENIVNTIHKAFSKKYCDQVEQIAKDRNAFYCKVRTNSFDYIIKWLMENKL